MRVSPIQVSDRIAQGENQAEVKEWWKEVATRESDYTEWRNGICLDRNKKLTNKED